ncbi:helix-turn-helix domain-containing protein [Chryseobacterium joostei]|uniref:helix-turn-helix domain-containing protein n=1 Tax=Chryseobacterium joostei TaxID=112234 RepID=UPI003D123791
MENTAYNGFSLKVVRDFYGISQSQFAKLLGISQPVISKLEKGDKNLEESHIKNFNEYFEPNFFKRNVENVNPRLFYRKLSSVTKSKLGMFESRLNLFYNTILEALEIVDLDSEGLPKIDINDYYREIDGDYKIDFEYIATEIRLKLGVGRGPIQNIIRLLEEKGVIVHFFDYDFISSDNNKFDGVSFYVKGVPVILINNKIPNSRKVFTIAHELGHLLLHFDDMIAIERDIETEANSFASAFLAPAKDIKSSLRQLNIEKLKSLKIEWNMSISSLVYRAYTLGTISQQTLRFWMMKLSPIRKNEPLEFELENPKLLKKLFEVLEIQTDSGFYKLLGFTERMRAELFGKDNIPLRPKLKIVLD